ncbi:MAG: spore germination protein GerW family protein [Bacillota bacterium]
MDIRDTLASLTTGFEKFINTKTLVGEPITIGDITLIPLISASCGVGGGGGQGSSPQAESAGKATGAGGGAGGGFRASPVAVIVVKGDSVEVLPVGRKGSALGKLLESLPSLVEKIGGKSKEDEETNE